jgi:hypothetical protein
MAIYMIIMSLTYGQHYTANVVMMPSIQMCERIGNEMIKMDKKIKYRCVK